MNEQEQQEQEQLLPPKPRVSRAVSRYFRQLSYLGAAAIRGTEAAKIRSAKAVAGRQAKRAERKAAAEEAAAEK
jgi:hypothetical protein